MQYKQTISSLIQKSKKIRKYCLVCYSHMPEFRLSFSTYLTRNCQLKAKITAKSVFSHSLCLNTFSVFLWRHGRGHGTNTMTQKSSAISSTVQKLKRLNENSIETILPQSHRIICTFESSFEENKGYARSLAILLPIIKMIFISTKGRVS